MAKEIRLVLVTRQTREFRQIKQLYQTAFPIRERVPFLLLDKKSNQGHADFWGVYDGDLWVGFAYVIRGEGLAYLFYFAIRPDFRGTGCGSATLRGLQETYQNENFFLALEQQDPKAKNYPERIRRHAFYEKNGLHDLPHRIREMTMVYDAMGTASVVAPSDFATMTRRFFGRFLYPLIHTKIIPDAGKSNIESIQERK